MSNHAQQPGGHRPDSNAKQHKDKPTFMTEKERREAADRALRLHSQQQRRPK